MTLLVVLLNPTYTVILWFCFKKAKGQGGSRYDNSCNAVRRVPASGMHRCMPVGLVRRIGAAYTCLTNRRVSWTNT